MKTEGPFPSANGLLSGSDGGPMCWRLSERGSEATAGTIGEGPGTEEAEERLVRRMSSDWRSARWQLNDLRSVDSVSINQTALFCSPPLSPPLPRPFFFSSRLQFLPPLVPDPPLALRFSPFSILPPHHQGGFCRRPPSHPRCVSSDGGTRVGGNSFLKDVCASCCGRKQQIGAAWTDQRRVVAFVCFAYSLYFCVCVRRVLGAVTCDLLPRRSHRGLAGFPGWS